MDNATSAEMPKYRSHKTVWALKIASIEYNRTPSGNPDPSADRADSCTAIITPGDAGYAPFKVDAEFVRKHDPKVGGYYVVYSDGYKSWSPAEAFEGGYTRI